MPYLTKSRKRNGRGLGVYNIVDPQTGKVIDCDAWSNLFNLTCWGGNSITGAGTGPYSNLVVPPAATTGSAGTVPDSSTYDPGVTDQAGVAASPFGFNGLTLAAVGFGAAVLLFSFMGRR